MTGGPDSPVAVVGASGFIGGALYRALVADGVAAVGLGRPRSPQDRAAALQAVRSASCVFYAAGTTTPALAAEQPLRAADEEVALARYLQACKLGGRYPLVVLLSSGGTVYAPELPPPYSEHSPTRATSEYGSAKLRQEHMLTQAAGFVRPVVLRMSNVYGIGQTSRRGLGVVAHWLDAAAEHRPLVMIGDPDTQRDYVYIDDAVDAALRLVHGRGSLVPVPADSALVLNIGSGLPTSLAQLARIVDTVVGRRLPVTQVAARAFDRRDLWLNVAAARTVLGWRPTTDLTTGIGRTWAWRAERRAPDRGCHARGG